MEKEFIRLYNAMSPVNKENLEYTQFKDLLRTPDFRATYFVNMRDKIAITNPTVFNRKVLYMQLAEQGKMDLPYQEFSQKIETDEAFSKKLHNESLNTHGVQKWDSFQNDFGLKFKTEEDLFEEELRQEYEKQHPLTEEEKSKREKIQGNISSHQKALQEKREKEYRLLFEENRIYDTGDEVLSAAYERQKMSPDQFGAPRPSQAIWKSQNPDAGDQLSIGQYEYEVKAMNKQMGQYANALAFLSEDVESRFPDLQKITGQYEYARGRVEGKNYEEWTDEDKEIYRSAYFAYQALQTQLGKDPKYQEYLRVANAANNLQSFASDYYLRDDTKMARQLVGKNLFEPFKTYDTLDEIPQEYLDNNDLYAVERQEDGKIEVSKRKKSVSEIMQGIADSEDPLLGKLDYRFRGTGVRGFGRALKTAARAVEVPMMIPEFATEVLIRGVESLTGKDIPNFVRQGLDVMVETAANISRDMDMTLPKSSDETRGAITKTYEYKDNDGKKYQIDLKKTGEIVGIYNEDGMAAKVDPMFINRLPSPEDMLAEAKSTQFRWTPILSMSADVTLDLMTLIAGTRGSGMLLKAGKLRNTVTMLAAQANIIRGQLVGDLIEEGLDAGLTRPDAITYANAVGFGIGAINGLFGISGKLVSGTAYGNVTDALSRWTLGGAKGLTKAGMNAYTPKMLAAARTKTIALNILGENFEELIAEPAWQELVQIMMTDSENIEFKPAFTGRDRDEILGEGVVTTMVSALFGAGTPLNLKEEAIAFIGRNPKKFMEVGKKLGFTEEELTNKRKEIYEELRRKRELRLAPDLKSVGTVDPRLEYTFTFETTGDIPKQFRSIKPIKINSIKHGSDKKVTITFTGQQLIDAKLAKEGKLSEEEFGIRGKINELEQKRSELIKQSDDLQAPVRQREEIQGRLQEIEQELLDENAKLQESQQERTDINDQVLRPELAQEVIPLRDNLTEAQQRAEESRARLEAQQNGEFFDPKEKDYVQLNVSLKDLGINAADVGAQSDTEIGITAVVTSVNENGTVNLRSDYFNGEITVQATPNIMNNITSLETLQIESQSTQEALTQSEQQYSEKVQEVNERLETNRQNEIQNNNQKRSDAETRLQELEAERTQLNQDLEAVPAEDMATIRKLDAEIEQLDKEINSLARTVTPEAIKLDYSIDSELNRQEAQREIDIFFGLSKEPETELTKKELDKAKKEKKADPRRLQSIAYKQGALTAYEQEMYELFKEEVDMRVAALNSNMAMELTQDQIKYLEEKYDIVVLTPERRSSNVIRELREQRRQLIENRDRLNREANEIRRATRKPEGPTNAARAKSAEVESGRKTALEAEGAVEDEINEKFDGRYRDSVRNGELELEEAIQAMELANRTESEVYDDLIDAREQGKNTVANDTFDTLSNLARATSEGETSFSPEDQKLIDENRQLFDLLTNNERSRVEELSKIAEDDTANQDSINKKYDNRTTNLKNKLITPSKPEVQITPELEEKQKEIDALNDEIALYNEALQRGPSNAPLEQARRERENATLNLGEKNKPTIEKNKHSTKVPQAANLDPLVEMVNDLFPDERMKGLFKNYLIFIKYFTRKFDALNQKHFEKFPIDKNTDDKLIPYIEKYNKLDLKTRRKILTIYKQLVKRLNEQDKADFEAYAKERGVQPRDNNLYTLAEVFKLIPLKGQSKAIYKVLKPFVDNFAIPFYIPSSRDEVMTDAVGRFYWNNIIYLSPFEFFNYLDQLKGNNTNYSGNGQEKLADTFIHELLHGFTVRIIDAVLNNVNDPAITENQRKAVLKLQKLYNEFAKDAVNDPNVREYAISNIKEFVAHLANKKFTDQLKKRKKGFLEKVYDAITQILGITKSNAKELLGVENAYDLAVKYVTDIISELPPGQSFGVPKYVRGEVKVRSETLEEAQRKYSEEKAKYETKINRLYAEIFGTEQAKKDAHHLPSTKLRKIKAEVRKRQAELRARVIELQKEYNEILDEARKKIGIDERVSELFGRKVDEEVVAEILEQEQAEIDKLVKEVQREYGTKGALSEKGMEKLAEGITKIRKKYNDIKLEAVRKVPPKIQQQLNELTEEIFDLNTQIRQEYEKRGVDPKGFGRSMFGPLVPSVEYTVSYSSEENVPAELKKVADKVVKTAQIDSNGRYTIVLDGAALIEAGLATKQEIEIESTSRGPMYKPRNRSELVETLVQTFGLSLEEAQANASLIDARAAAWAKRNNKRKNDWYKERLEGIVKNNSQMPTNFKLASSIYIKGVDGSPGSRYLTNLRQAIERVSPKTRTLKAWINDLIRQSDHATLMDLRRIGMITMSEMWDTYEELQLQRRLRINANQDTFDLDQKIGQLRAKLPKTKFTINPDFAAIAEEILSKEKADLNYTNLDNITEKQLYYLIVNNYLENSNDIRMMDVLELSVSENSVEALRNLVASNMNEAFNNNYDKAKFIDGLKKLGVATPIAKKVANFFDLKTKGTPTFEDYSIYYYTLQSFLEQSGLADNTNEANQAEKNRILAEMDRVAGIMKKLTLGEKIDASHNDRVVETADGRQLMRVQMPDGSFNFIRPEVLGRTNFPEPHHQLISFGMAKEEGMSESDFAARSLNGVRLNSNLELYEPTEEDYQQGDTVYQTKDGEQRAAIVTTGDGKIIIHALTNPDVSSPLHELAHEFESELTADEIRIVERWSKATFGTIDFREKFAKGFEAYVMEGRTENAKLANVFDRFAIWLQTMYNNVLEYNGERIVLNRKMRKIYARMLDADLAPVSDKVILSFTKLPNIANLLDRIRFRRRRKKQEEDEETRRIRELREQIKQEREQALEDLKNRKLEKDELRDLEQERENLAKQIDANVKKFTEDTLTLGERAELLNLIEALINRVNQITDRIAVLNEIIESEPTKEEIDNINDDFDEKLEEAIKGEETAEEEILAPEEAQAEPEQPASQATPQQPSTPTPNQPQPSGQQPPSQQPPSSQNTGKTDEKAKESKRIRRAANDPRVDVELQEALLLDEDSKYLPISLQRVANAARIVIENLILDGLSYSEIFEEAKAGKNITSQIPSRETKEQEQQRRAEDAMYTIIMDIVWDRVRQTGDTRLAVQMQQDIARFRRTAATELRAGIAKVVPESLYSDVINELEEKFINNLGQKVESGRTLEEEIASLMVSHSPEEIQEVINKVLGLQGRPATRIKGSTKASKKGDSLIKRGWDKFSKGGRGQLSAGLIFNQDQIEGIVDIITGLIYKFKGNILKVKEAFVEEVDIYNLLSGQNYDATAIWNFLTSNNKIDIAKIQEQELVDRLLEMEERMKQALRRGGPEVAVQMENIYNLILSEIEKITSENPELGTVQDVIKNRSLKGPAARAIRNSIIEQFRFLEEEEIALLHNVLDKVFIVISSEYNTSFGDKIRQGARELGTTLSEVVINHYTKGDQSQSLSSKLVQALNLSPMEARKFQEEFKLIWKDLMEDKKKKILKQRLKENLDILERRLDEAVRAKDYENAAKIRTRIKKLRKKTKSATQRMVEELSMGVLNEARMADLWFEKYAIAEGNRDKIEKLKELVDKANKAFSVRDKERIYKEIDYEIARLKKDPWKKLFLMKLQTLGIVNLLSGFTSGVRAFLGAFKAAGPNLMRDFMVLLPQYATAFVRGRKNEREALSYIMGELFRGEPDPEINSIFLSYANNVKNFISRFIYEFGYQLKYGIATTRYNDPTGSGFSPLDIEINNFMENIFKVSPVKNPSDLKKYIARVMLLAYTPPMLAVRALAMGDMLIKSSIMNFKAAQVARAKLIDNGVDPNDADFVIKLKTELGRIHQAEIKEQVEEEIAILKTAGKKIPLGYKQARIRELRVTKMNPELVEEAAYLADEALIMHVTQASRVANVRIKEKDNVAQMLGKMILMTLFPIVRTPAAFIEQATYYTPFGLIAGGINVFSEGSTQEAKEKGYRQMAAATLGFSTFISLFFSMFDFDDDEEGNKILKVNDDWRMRITGLGSTNFVKDEYIDKHYRILELQIRPFPKKYPDWVISMNYADSPLGIVLYPIGQMYDAAALNPKSENSVNQANLSIILGGLQFITAQSFSRSLNEIVKLAGISEAVDPTTDTAKEQERKIIALAKFLGEKGSMYVPLGANLYSQMSKAYGQVTDKPRYIPETTTFTETYAYNLVKRAFFSGLLTPYLSGEKRALLDPLGKPVEDRLVFPENFLFMNNALEMLDNWVNETSKKSPGHKLFLSRTNLNVQNRYWMPGNTVTHKGNTYKLNNQEKIELANRVATIYGAKVDQYAMDYDYENMSTEKLLEDFKKLREEAIKEAKDQYLYYGY